MTAPGAFSREFAEKKDWKLDNGLVAAIRHTVPAGATITELGAGIGRYVSMLRDEGYISRGYDGIEEIDVLSEGVVEYMDLTECQDIVQWEWGLCFEVLEHIPAEFEEVAVGNVANCARKGLMVSVAVPGQRGKGHVNCMMPEKVSNMLGRFGWRLDQHATQAARRAAGKGWDKKLLVLKK